MSQIGHLRKYKKGETVDELEIFVLIFVHCASSLFVTYRLNFLASIGKFPKEISPYFVTPRSLAILWSELFGMRFLKRGDLVLKITGIVHILTTTSILVILIRLVISGLPN